MNKLIILAEVIEGLGLSEYAASILKLGGMKRKSEPKVGTGKKPKGSSRRLYTDENPKDTVRVKFSTAEDIRETLSKESFKSKSHARQSQIINLIHQRVRAAYENAKDAEVKERLGRALRYAEKRKEASKRKTESQKRLGKKSFVTLGLTKTSGEEIESLPSLLHSVRGDLARIAQETYDEWEQDEEGWSDSFGEIGVGGICHIIADKYKI